MRDEELNRKKMTMQSDKTTKGQRVGVARTEKDREHDQERKEDEEEQEDVGEYVRMMGDGEE